MSTRYTNLITGRAARLPTDRAKCVSTPKRNRKSARRRVGLPPPPASVSVSPVAPSEQRDLFPKHERASITIRLGLPPSINNYRAIFTPPKGGRARMITSADGRSYCRQVRDLWLNHFHGWPPEPLTGRLRLSVVVAYFDRRDFDLDNRMKPIQDALKAAGAYVDDSQIDELHAARGPVSPAGGYADVTIEVIG